jgi:hypothetical protein
MSWRVQHADNSRLLEQLHISGSRSVHGLLVQICVPRTSSGGSLGSCTQRRFQWTYRQEQNYIAKLVYNIRGSGELPPRFLIYPWSVAEAHLYFEVVSGMLGIAIT